ncbi:transcriptional regulator, AraC family protein [Marinobacter lipolyticus SM19]|uniref:Transcriptional regulator, AraC family protein n=2 Tax=Marinobacter lipolyticus TaxID=209639 RepID=R8AWY4_9GAMM|nr:transcriptional regulator, AraC family protein [Marinobacter lipolyticus SM19]
MKLGAKSCWQNPGTGSKLERNDSFGVRMDQQQEKEAPKRCTSVADDANEHAGNLTNWHQQYDQVGNGRFHGRIDELHLDGIQLFIEHTSHAVRQQCMVWPESIWFGIPSRNEDVRINGQQAEHTDILCRPGSRHFELVTPDSFDMLSLVVHQRELKQQSESQGIELKVLDTSSYPRLKLPVQTLRNIQYLLRRIVRTESSRLDGQIHHDLLIMAVLELLTVEKPNRTVAPSYAHRKAVVEKIKAYVNTVDDLPVTMAKLCEVGCVSRRTLQYSFESILGISPLQFLRISRLNRVRRMLREEGAQSVSDIAAFNGFYHHSQFSADYKQLFGECPSETLGRCSGEVA